jgi:hypothetical protein
MDLILYDPFHLVTHPNIRVRHDPYIQKWVNYYAIGDIISGELAPSIQLPYDTYTTPEYDKFEDKIIDSTDSRTFGSTKLYHAITSLDARDLEYDIRQDTEIRGSWAKEVVPENKLDLARYFRARVRCDIISAIDEETFCTKFDTNFDDAIDTEELTYARELEEAGEITTAELLEAIAIWKYGPSGVGDADSDGFNSDIDCNDYNPDKYPNAPELCDGIDNQCPGDEGYGTIDEGCTPCHEADTNCDGCIDTNEIVAYIEKWKLGEVTITNLINAMNIWKACDESTEEFIYGEWDESIDYGCDEVVDEENKLIFYEDHTFESIPRCNGYEGTWEFYPEEDRIRFTFNGCDYPVYEGGAGYTISSFMGTFWGMIGEIEGENTCWSARKDF